MSKRERAVPVWKCQCPLQLQVVEALVGSSVVHSSSALAGEQTSSFSSSSSLNTEHAGFKSPALFKA